MKDLSKYIGYAKLAGSVTACVLLVALLFPMDPRSKKK